ncbi:MAG: acetate--CoA ligase family protein [Nanoarchaeota archaeon]|nr:acetate--CoA ligase family protein [Nanoarchaeota archaeon]
MVKLLGIDKAQGFLSDYNIPLAKSKVVKTKFEAKKEAKNMKYPVVLKINSKNIIHKTEAGGVIKDINCWVELENAFGTLSRSFKDEKDFLLQKQIEGIEIFAGMKRDPSFGPVIAFGLGGIFVEIMKDVVFRIAPINKNEAKEMIKSIKGYPILKGARGKEGVNVNSLAEILVNLSKLAMDKKKIKEFDFNPIIINKRSAKVVDARFLL